MALSPYGFYDKNSTPQGNLFEFAHAILKQGKFQGDASILPLKRLTQSILVDKKLDCSIFGKVSFVREHYDIVEPIGIDVNFSILPREGVTIEKYSDLAKLTIGVPLGVKIGERFDNDNSLNKIAVNNYESGMLMLKYQRIDAIAGVISSLQFSGKINNVLSNEYSIPFIIKNLPFVVGCRPQFLTNKLEMKLRAVIVELRENGTFSAINDGYRYER